MTENLEDEVGLVPVNGGAMEVSPELAAELAGMQQTAEELGGTLLDMLAIYAADSDRWKTGPKDAPIKKEEVWGIFLYGVNSMRTFWPPDAEMGTEPPTCWSMGGEDATPHENAIEPQNETCEGCHWNEFKTAKQGTGKACKTKRADFFVELDPTKLTLDENGNYTVTAEAVLGVALLRGSATSRETRRSVGEWAKALQKESNGVGQLVITKWTLVLGKSGLYHAPTLTCMGRYTCDTEALQDIVRMARELREGEAESVLTILAGSSNTEEETEE